MAAHTWSKSGISICWRQLVKAKESSNPMKFSEITYFTSYVRNMFWATILYKYQEYNGLIWPIFDNLDPSEILLLWPNPIDLF